MAGRTELYLGLDVGGTKCAAVVGDAQGEIIDRMEWPSLADRGSAAMVKDLSEHGLKLLAKHSGVVAAGASIGGPLDAANGVIYSPPNLPGWENVPLKSIMEQTFGLPSRVEHDAAACCLAEARWGAGVGATRLVYLTCGTGLGVGLVFDGDIYRGAAGQNAEIGHARFREDGPDAFGKRGSVEAFCAAGALGKIANWKFPQRWPQIPNPKDICDLARTGDVQAQTVLEISARSVGELCATIGDFLRPDMILIGSLAKYLGEEWMDLVRQEFVEESMPQTVKHCSIRAAGLGERLQDCSALIVAVSAASGKTREPALATAGRG
jgi:glucokinase